MSIEKIQQLKDAYEWEQERLRAWVEELERNHSAKENADLFKLPMHEEFYKAWSTYFKEIMASNAYVIKMCNLAIGDKDTDDERYSTPLVNTIINTHNHNNRSMDDILRVTDTHQRQSPYFFALHKTIVLEDDIRDKIEAFLNS